MNHRHAEIVQRIEIALHHAFNGEEWERLESSGSDEYLAACDVVELVRVLRRLIVEGHAPDRVIEGVRAALRMDREDGER